MQRRKFIKSVLGSALLWKAPALLALRGPSKPPAPDPEVKRVLVMFKCHFDAGFVDTQTAVVRRYFKEYFPRAMDLASQLRQSGSHRQYKHPAKPGRVTIPGHPGDDLHPGTLKSVLAQAGLKDKKL